MMTGFSFKITQLFLSLDNKIVFVCALILGVACFILNLILMVAKNGYGIKKRIWLFITYLGLYLLQKAAGYSQAEDPLCTYLFAILLLLCLPSVIIPEKTPPQDFAIFSALQGKTNLKKDTMAEEKGGYVDFGNAVQEELNFPLPKEPVANLSPKPLPDCIDKESKQSDEFANSQDVLKGLDFSHVKNVISRLDSFGLSVADKKQVKELQLAIKSAETGDILPDTKIKINDGLGALLKIMSKYGV